MNRHKRYPPEVRERAVRLVLEHQEDYDSQWAALTSIADKIGCTAETLRKWVRRAEIDQGQRAGLTSAERDQLRELKREISGTEAGQRDSAQRPQLFSPKRSSTANRRAGDLHRPTPGRYWGRAESANSLPVAPSTYYEHKARAADPGRLPARARRDSDAVPGDTAYMGGQLPGIRRQEGVAPAATGRACCGPLYGGATDETSLKYRA